MDQPKLCKAMTTLEFLSQDREARRLYEMRQKALLDEHWKVEGQEWKGRRGRQKLLQMGMEISSIAKTTGLTQDKIRKLAEPDD